jgi:hypothetical protein
VIVKSFVKEKMIGVQRFKVQRFKGSRFKVHRFKVQGSAPPLAASVQSNRKRNSEKANIE